MKYMIMLYGSQAEYDAMTGANGQSEWTAADFAAMGEFMEKWNNSLVESGEFVDARGLDAPVHTRRVQLQQGVPVVTDGPYPETAEVLAGYTIVECVSFDRATEIAAQLSTCPNPRGERAGYYVDVRPVMDDRGDLLEA